MNLSDSIENLTTIVWLELQGTYLRRSHIDGFSCTPHENSDLFDVEFLIGGQWQVFKPITKEHANTIKAILNIP